MSVGALRVVVQTDVSRHALIRIEVGGELDFATADYLMEEVERAVGARGHNVELDLSSLHFCAVTGMSALVKIHERLIDQGGHLTLSGCSPILLRHLELARLTHRLDIVSYHSDPASRIFGKD